MADPHPPADNKNWTWVLERPCTDCGFDAGAVDRNQIGAKLRANAASFRDFLGRKAVVRRRPPVGDGEPPVWSALEYACHVRDVHQLFGDRLSRMLKSGIFRSKTPTFADWDQDQAAIDGRYAEADPDKVAYALAVNAGKAADELDRVSGDQWQRPGIRSDGDTFTVESLARYFLHDVTHHAWDVQEGFKAIAEFDKAKAKAAKEAKFGAAETSEKQDEEPST